jgi:hypothetical protein
MGWPFLPVYSSICPNKSTPIAGTQCCVMGSTVSHCCETMGDHIRANWLKDSVGQLWFGTTSVQQSPKMQQRHAITLALKWPTMEGHDIRATMKDLGGIAQRMHLECQHTPKSTLLQSCNVMILLKQSTVFLHINFHKLFTELVFDGRWLLFFSLIWRSKHLKRKILSYLWIPPPPTKHQTC